MPKDQEPPVRRSDQTLVTEGKPITEEGLIEKYHLDPQDPQQNGLLKEILVMRDGARFTQFLDALTDNLVHRFRRKQQNQHPTGDRSAA